MESGNRAQTITNDAQGAHNQACIAIVGSPTNNFHEGVNAVLIDEANGRVGPAAQVRGNFKTTTTLACPKAVHSADQSTSSGQEFSLTVAQVFQRSRKNCPSLLCACWMTTFLHCTWVCGCRSALSVQSYVMNIRQTPHNNTQKCMIIFSQDRY